MNKRVVGMVVVATLSAAIGAFVGMSMTATSFFHMYGEHQTPYSMKKLYDECVNTLREYPDGTYCVMVPEVMGGDDIREVTGYYE